MPERLLGGKVLEEGKGIYENHALWNHLFFAYQFVSILLFLFFVLISCGPLFHERFPILVPGQIGRFIRTISGLSFVEIVVYIYNRGE